MALIVLGIGAVIFLAHFLSALFRRTMVPDVLILMAFGVVMGPLTGVVSPEHLGKVGSVIATIALVVILFESGISLDLKALTQSAGLTLRFTISNFLMTSLVVALLGETLLALETLQALFLGAALGGTSAAVVIPLVHFLRLSSRISSVLVLESAFTDVLCILSSFSILQVIASGTLALGVTLGTLMASLIFAIVIGALGGVGWLLVLRKVRDFPNTISSTLAYVFIVYGLTEWLGYSGPIAALATGITMANFQRLATGRIDSLAWEVEALNDFDLAFYREAVFLLKTYFFVFLGISIPLSSPGTTAIALVLVLAVYLIRLGISRLLMGESTIELRDAAHAAMLGPKGLAAAVLASLPLDRGIPGGEVIRDTAYMVVTFSILLSSGLVFAYRRPAVQRLFGLFLGKSPEKAHPPLSQDGSSRGDSRSDQTPPR